MYIYSMQYYSNKGFWGFGVLGFWGGCSARPLTPATSSPGLRLGRAVAYPEREVREPGVVEAALRGFVASRPRAPQTLLRLRARRVCALAARYELAPDVLAGERPA